MTPFVRSRTLVALVAVIALVAACSGTTGGLGSVPTSEPTASAEPTSPDLTPGPSASVAPSDQPSSEPSGSPEASVTPSATPSSTDTMIVRNYFVLGADPGSVGLVPVLRVVPKTTAVATTAMRSLLAGPAPIQGESFGPATSIPDGTRLLGLTVKSGIATVNLSTEFDSGTGQDSMQFRLAQVVYTLTQFSTIKSVLFQIDGVTVTVFGSEGIVLDGPVGRADYQAQLPAIFVDRPAYKAAFASGDRVAGNANVFEATFRVAVIDAGGKTLVDQQVMASCGTGCRGTFNTTLAYTVSKGQWGTLRAYDLSAKDGTPENVREYPVWLTPGG